MSTPFQRFVTRCFSKAPKRLPGIDDIISGISKKNKQDKSSAAWELRILEFLEIPVKNIGKWNML